MEKYKKYKEVVSAKNDKVQFHSFLDNTVGEPEISSKQHHAFNVVTEFKLIPSSGAR